MHQHKIKYLKETKKKQKQKNETKLSRNQNIAKLKLNY